MRRGMDQRAPDMGQEGPVEVQRGPARYWARGIGP